MAVAVYACVEVTCDDMQIIYRER